MKVGFDGGIKLEFHGAKVTSDGGLLAYRDLDDALGLFYSVSANFHDNRTGRNIRQLCPPCYANPSIVVWRVTRMLMMQGDYPLILSCELLPGKTTMASKPPAPTRWGVSKWR